MTANEMVVELENRVERMGSRRNIPSYEDADYSGLLNDAVQAFIKKIIDKLNAKSSGLEESELRTQGLSALVQNATPTPSSDQTGVSPNGTFYDLPENFYIAIREFANTDILDCTIPDNTTVYVNADITPKSHGEYNLQIKNPYRKPELKADSGEIWRFGFSRDNSGYDDISAITDKRHELITDGSFNITQYNLRYLITHPDIVVDFDTPANQRNCILDPATHTSIVDIAKDKMSERIVRTQPSITPGSDDLE